LETEQNYEPLCKGIITGTPIAFFILTLIFNTNAIFIKAPYLFVISFIILSGSSYSLLSYYMFRINVNKGSEDNVTDPNPLHIASLYVVTAYIIIFIVNKFSIKLYTEVNNFSCIPYIMLLTPILIIFILGREHKRCFKPPAKKKCMRKEPNKVGTSVIILGFFVFGIGYLAHKIYGASSENTSVLYLFIYLISIIAFTAYMSYFACRNMFHFSYTEEIHTFAKNEKIWRYDKKVIRKKKRKSVLKYLKNPKTIKGGALKQCRVFQLFQFKNKLERGVALNIILIISGFLTFAFCSILSSGKDPPYAIFFEVNNHLDLLSSLWIVYLCIGFMAYFTAIAYGMVYYFVIIFYILPILSIFRDYKNSLPYVELNPISTDFISKARRIFLHGNIFFWLECFSISISVLLLMGILDKGFSFLSTQVKGGTHFLVDFAPLIVLLIVLGIIGLFLFTYYPTHMLKETIHTLKSKTLEKLSKRLENKKLKGKDITNIYEEMRLVNDSPLTIGQTTSTLVPIIGAIIPTGVAIIAIIFGFKPG